MAIEHYEFIDKKPDGTKERVLGTTIYLYNKLSADETNAIRAKLNELVDAVNFEVVPLYEAFSLKFKGEDNIDMLTIEVGDVAHRYSTIDGIWENAVFNGGDPQDPASYTRIEATKPDPELFTAVATGANQTFELPSGFTAGSVLKSKGELYKGTEWTQIGATLTILINVNAGNTIYVKP